MAEDRKLPLLLIDFSKDPEANVELTDAAMAKALGGPDGGWSAEKVRMVRLQHGLFSHIPLTCPGKANCDHKQECQLSPETINKEYKGKNCPVEVIAAFRAFAGFVLDLEIQPEDYSDLKLVADLVRLDLLVRRCDIYQKDKPVWEHQLAQVDKQGTPYYNKVPVLTFGMMTQIRKDVKEIYDQLIASRAAKVKRDASMKDVKGASDVMSHIRKLGEDLMKKQAEDNRKRLKLVDSELPALEGQIVEHEIVQEQD